MADYYYGPIYPVTQPPPVPPDYLGVMMYAIFTALNNATPPHDMMWCGKETILSVESIEYVYHDSSESPYYTVEQKPRRENVAKGILMMANAGESLKDLIVSNAKFTLAKILTGTSVSGGAVTIPSGQTMEKELGWMTMDPSE